jgi:hypothetical protein
MDTSMPTLGSNRPVQAQTRTLSSCIQHGSQSDPGPSNSSQTATESISNPVQPCPARMCLYRIPFRMICELFQIGCHSGCIGAGPYPTRPGPISILYLAVTCRTSCYMSRCRMLCGLFRIGCGSDHIGVGPCMIHAGSSGSDATVAASVQSLIRPVQIRCRSCA